MLSEMRNIIREEVQNSLASMSQREVYSPGPARKRPRKDPEQEVQDGSSEAESEYRGSDQEEGELPVEEQEGKRYYFPVEETEELVQAVRRTMQVKEDPQPRSRQDQMFGGLTYQERTVFPEEEDVLQCAVRMDSWKPNYRTRMQPCGHFGSGDCREKTLSTRTLLTSEDGDEACASEASVRLADSGNESPRRTRLATVKVEAENVDPEASSNGGRTSLLRLTELEVKPDTPIIPSVRSRIQMMEGTSRTDGAQGVREESLSYIEGEKSVSGMLDPAAEEAAEPLAGLSPCDWALEERVLAVTHSTLRSSHEEVEPPSTETASRLRQERQEELAMLCTVIDRSNPWRAASMRRPQKRTLDPASQDLSGGKRRRRVRVGRGSVKMGPVLDSDSSGSECVELSLEGNDGSGELSDDRYVSSLEVRLRRSCDSDSLTPEDPPSFICEAADSGSPAGGPLLLSIGSLRPEESSNGMANFLDTLATGISIFGADSHVLYHRRYVVIHSNYPILQALRPPNISSWTVNDSVDSSTFMVFRTACSRVSVSSEENKYLFRSPERNIEEVSPSPESGSE
ncbi:unnamed protein product [Ranitomeya imitator]|uniref:Uncharacterized protein n=1 Tax=Ranitomeya imitator TaxID=111125 RepID=A0ABN9M7A0_9NEOB|nr:unnamed protein product [Ranitomeya imitator]